MFLKFEIDFFKNITARLNKKNLLLCPRIAAA